MCPLYVSRKFQSTSSMRRVTVGVSLLILKFLFQSTSSMRRVTGSALGWYAALWHISIHILHAEGDDYMAEHYAHSKDISIHILHAEGDSPLCDYAFQFLLFQSTSSMRRVTQLPLTSPRLSIISIHILHAEGDEDTFDSYMWQTHFNPHPPCGG